ncbi:pyrroline-5-carboxylate reductase [Rhizobium sp. 1399]|nr:hypothetical protein [Rhizobium sp. 1399]MDR6665414.1 pyrroline-5-carboxylate reductase [Rhizobium sp. 1399]
MACRVGLAQSKAHSYLAPLFERLARCANEDPDASVVELSREFATKGGLNEQVLTDFQTKGGQASLHDALGRVLARIQGRP